MSNASTTGTGRIVEPRPAHRLETLLASAPAALSRKDALAVASLVVLWAWQLWTSWAAWGDLTVDSGHEMYVPTVLAEGGTLYRDTWFMYGPVAPYFNSFLFRVFGIHLNVLYWAGASAALVSAVLLVGIGRRLGARRIGWAAGVVLLLQAFERSLFCFPLPYSFSAVYGCVLACAFALAAILAVQLPALRWCAVAGSLAGVALMTKPEFGLAAYATLGAVVLLRGVQGQGSTAKDLLSTVPGVVFVVATSVWMVSLRGVDFITQENVSTWPTSYFMRTYGTMWLAHTGFSLTGPAFGDAVIRLILPAGLVAELYAVLRWRRNDTGAVLLRLMLFLALLRFTATYVGFAPDVLARALAFPPDMVLYVIVGTAATWIAYARSAVLRARPATLVLLTFTSCLAFRLLFMMGPVGYPIYYNGLVIIGFLILARVVLAWALPPSLTAASSWILPLACVAAVMPDVGHAKPVAGLEALTTARGTIRVPHDLAVNYRVAIDFMRTHSRPGEYVASVPEDTSLYFLSETHCPTRMYSYTPGVVSPGSMTEQAILEMERNGVRYLLWSNRTFREYGAPYFGVDFNREIGDYFRSRYVRRRRLTPNPGWTADLWERKETVR